MFDLAFLEALLSIALFLPAILFALYIFWPVFLEFFRKDSDKTALFAKRKFRIGISALLFCVGLIVAIVLLYRETDTLLDMIVRFFAVMTLAAFYVGSALNAIYPSPPERTRSGKAAAEKEIRVDKIVFWIGMFGTHFSVIMLSAMILFPNDTATWWVFLSFAIFLVIGILILLWYLNSRIILEEDHFVYRNVWRVTKKISYDSVKSCKITNQYIILYTEKKKYRFERGSYVGIEGLREKVEARLKEKEDVRRD